ncbi:energy-coupling factor transporter ATPase [Mitsuokella sp. oral taxon 131]|uniref:energy-coupling factor transporter ATPase n=1 Tax=Mitsuokella sp. oral taxon 131 TaxID=1321780 RepID=UPI0003ADB745|nr:energy-coupling factor transporter ATPase [Mitsuokella sp. oral taxon 131]ERL05033.1 cobalt ABC transporter, ATP-binding protein [Mitsuokella sp. oral taxon 131 str. W9106]
MSFIEMEHLSHAYHAGDETERMALSDVSLAIEKGEFVAVLGANGSGKSTLAKHINAILLPTAGNCRVAGFDTSEAGSVWEIRREVGMVFQNPDNQLIAAIVEDDVAFGPENIGMAPERIRENVRCALAAVGMEHFRSFAPHLLSGGQKQRVAIAGALAMQPKCLVLDEPTAMLDPKGREEVMMVLKRLHAEGMTVVLITHFMEEASEAQRVIIMADGRIAAIGTPREVLTDHAAMQKWGLETPLAACLAAGLLKDGVKLPRDILTDDDLICALTGEEPCPSK